MADFSIKIPSKNIKELLTVNHRKSIGNGTYSYCILGTRTDVKDFKIGCKDYLKYSDSGNNIKKGNPTFNELMKFFSQTPEWMFWGSHASVNELGEPVLYSDYTEVLFTKKENVPSVQVKIANSENRWQDIDCETIKMKSENGLKVSIWGGCSIFRDTNKIAVDSLREFFGTHLLLGFSGVCSWRITENIFTGSHTKSGKSFFDRLAHCKTDENVIAAAWLDTIADFINYTNHPNDEMKTWNTIPSYNGSIHIPPSFGVAVLSDGSYMRRK